MLTIPQFIESGFDKHCFTTRIGGVSPGEFNSLNLSKTREENQANKEENYHRVCDALGVEYNSLALVNYAHGDGIHFAAQADAGKGFTKQMDYAACDAMVTDTPNVTAVTLHADCVPIFVADREKRVAAVAHAGWKGVYAGLPEKLVCGIIEKYRGKPQNILVGIGPHIMPCCFEVQDDVALPFRERFGNQSVHLREEKQFVDMQAAILMQLKKCDIPDEHITVADLCTSCRDDLFYSHRRDHGHTGAMGSFITV